MSDRASVTKRLPRIRGAAAVLALLGAALCGAGFAADRTQFFRSYLFAYLACLQVALGCLGLLMIHHLVGGAWGSALRRFLESGAGCLPAMAILFLPLCFGLAEVYPWARPETVSASKALLHKAAYLNVPFFLARAAICFAIWISIQHFLKKWARPQGEEAVMAMQAGARSRLAALSGPGLVLFGITVHFASFDWAMSLEPEWYSTMYGFLFIAGEAPAVMALMILSALGLDRKEAVERLVAPANLYDLGNLLLAFVLIWIYVSFMQFLIIWSGNLPEETGWYLRRMAGGWRWLAGLLVLFQFALPFFLLLFRSFKRNARALAWLSAGLLLVHVAHVFWLVAPAFPQARSALHWQDPASLAALGGVWTWVFLRGLMAPSPIAAEESGGTDGR
jgi:hypothetical protein